MTTRAKILIAVWFISTSLVAISALLPGDGYPYGADYIFFPVTYAWEYPVGFGIVAAIGVVLLSPWSPRPTFIGATCATILLYSLCVLTVMTIMHSSMVHEHLMFISFAWSQSLLVYTGYAFGIRRRRPKPVENTA